MKFGASLHSPTRMLGFVTVLCVATYTAENITQRIEPIVLYFKSKASCPECQEVRREFATVSDRYPGKLCEVDCDTGAAPCKDSVQKYPTIQMIKPDMVFTYGEPAYDAETITKFVEVTMGSVFIDAPSKAAFHGLMQEHGMKQYFIFYGPSREEGEELFGLFRGVMRVMYVPSPNKKLLAFRNGIQIEYRGAEFMREQVHPFVTQQLQSLMPRLEMERISRYADQLMSVVFIYNSSESSHKEIGSWLKRFATYHMTAQTLVGRWFYWFTLDVSKPHEFPDLLRLTKATPKPGQAPKIMVLGKQKTTYRLWDLDTQQLEPFLAGVFDGTFKLNGIQKK